MVRVKVGGKIGHSVRRQAILLLPLGLLYGSLCQGGDGLSTSGDVSLSDSAVALDKYGGLNSIVLPSRGAGYFRLEKLGNRWMLVTPDDHPFWYLGVALVSSAPGKDPDGRTYDEYVLSKYGKKEVWASQVKLRLLSWGFNGLGMYESSFVRSYGSFGRKPVEPLMPHFNDRPGFAYHSMINAGGYLASPVKNILGELKAGMFPDVFDPGFQQYAFKYMAENTRETTGGLKAELDSRWVIGYITDESDELTGSGPAETHIHLGWAALATPPALTSGKILSKSVTYSDPTVYTKLALRDFLKKRYAENIEALNSAWHSSYTSWDSAGEYGTGTGLLDEDGRHRWTGDRRSLAGATDVLKADLNDFLFLIAKQYFQVAHDAIRSVDQNHLIFGPVSLTADSRPQILLAAKDYVDAFVARVERGWGVPSAEVYDVTGRPVLAASHFFTAERDTPLAILGIPSPRAANTVSDTQEQRALAYSNYIKALLHVRGKDGVSPVLGFHWWALVDNWSEKRNFGLVTVRDNAYDGKEAVVGPGTDSRGYPVGGEERDYGAFIPAAREANLEIMVRLLAELRNHSQATDDQAPRPTKTRLSQAKASPGRADTD